MERVRRRATKLMVGSKLSYPDSLLKTGLMSLSSRRIYLDLLSYLNAYMVNMTLMCLVIYNFLNWKMNLII